MMFHVGQKVVCVDDRPSFYGDSVSLQKNTIYTIAAVFTKLDADGDYGVEVVETRDCFDGLRYMGGSAYRASRFRPVHTTSIEIFEAMLVPTPTERVDA